MAIRLISTQEAANILGVTGERVRQLAKRGQLRVAVLGPMGRRLYDTEDVLALRSAREVAGF